MYKYAQLWGIGNGALCNPVIKIQFMYTYYTYSTQNSVMIITYDNNKYMHMSNPNYMIHVYHKISFNWHAYFGQFWTRFAQTDKFTWTILNEVINVYLWRTSSAYMPYLTLCEIKSHRIWPIWKPIPIRFFKSHRIFRPSYNTFHEEININHTFLCLSQASYISIKAFDYFSGAAKWFL